MYKKSEGKWHNCIVCIMALGIIDLNIASNNFDAMVYRTRKYNHTFKISERSPIVKS